MRRTVVLGFLGSTLDIGKSQERWKRWRPTVALCQQKDLVVHRLDLLYGARFRALADRIIEDISVVSPKTEVRLHDIHLKNAWDFAEVYAGLHEFAENYLFRPEEEDYLVNITTGTHVAQICWFLLTEAHYVPARLLQLSPPRKKSDPEDMVGSHSIIDLDLSRYDEIATRFDAEKTKAASFLKSGIATRNKIFNDMIDEIEQVAIRSTAPVLLTGPTGAGKSQLARRIFALKKAQHQVSGEFVEVNCATLRGDQAMSTLFGHVRGAFTGALSERAGLMKAADKGVLFLDEIGELGLDEQAMCLQAIEEKRFLPMGSDKPANSHFQLIAGTNRDLSAQAHRGRFREDLLARLNLWTFQLPPLKERREDIEPNIDYELERFSVREGRKVTFNAQARTAFVAFALSESASWAANFRDLSASLTRMATLAPNGRINEETVAAEIMRLQKLWQPEAVPARPIPLAEAVLGARAEEFDIFDRAQLSAVIDICRQSKSLSAAGRTLFSVSRTKKSSGNDTDRLRKYLSRFDLHFDEIARS